MYYFSLNIYNMSYVFIIVMKLLRSYVKITLKKTYVIVYCEGQERFYLWFVE